MVVTLYIRLRRRWVGWVSIGIVAGAIGIGLWCGMPIAAAQAGFCIPNPTNMWQCPSQPGPQTPAPGLPPNPGGPPTPPMQAPPPPVVPPPSGGTNAGAGNAQGNWISPGDPNNPILVGPDAGPTPRAGQNGNNVPQQAPAPAPAVQAPAAQPGPASAEPPQDLASQLARLASEHNEGILNDSEFAAAKADLINGFGRSASAPAPYAPAPNVNGAGPVMQNPGVSHNPAPDTSRGQHRGPSDPRLPITVLAMVTGFASGRASGRGHPPLKTVSADAGAGPPDTGDIPPGGTGEPGGTGHPPMLPGGRYQDRGYFRGNDGQLHPVMPSPGDWDYPDPGAAVPTNDETLIVPVGGGGKWIYRGGRWLFRQGRNQPETKPQQPTSPKEELDFNSRPERLDHSFASKHKLDGVVQRAGGRVRAMVEILQALRASGQNLKPGVFETIVRVEGENITVRGFVDGNGIIKISTMFIP